MDHESRIMAHTHALTSPWIRNTVFAFDPSTPCQHWLKLLLRRKNHEIIGLLYYVKQQ